MNDDEPQRDVLFDVMTPLGFRVRVTREHWGLIVTVKHPAMRGRDKDVQETLQAPTQIRQSKCDSQVLLFYKPERIGR